MEEAIVRLKLAADAGADVCFIEGVKNKELLEATVAALAPKPVSHIDHGLLFSPHHQWYPGPRQRYFGRSYALVHVSGSRADGRQNNQCDPLHLVSCSYCPNNVS